jgi:hypothetical protein
MKQDGSTFLRTVGSPALCRSLVAVLVDLVGSPNLGISVKFIKIWSRSVAESVSVRRYLSGPPGDVRLRRRSEGGDGQGLRPREGHES